MQAIPVIAIFDIGKTNKKLFLFNEQYRIVHEECIQLTETVDEDGDACEDIHALTSWVCGTFHKVSTLQRFDIKTVNFSAYGASLVYVDKKGQVITPLYNYLKHYPAALQQELYDRYGGEDVLSMDTASPALGSLNSGLQMYRIKKEQPDVFNRIAFAFHLPQYLSYLFTDYPSADITSIGCHTCLWDFTKQSYHRWVIDEELDLRLPPVITTSAVFSFNYKNRRYGAGIGLHDSSAALIPYLASFTEPFVLISTGTWCISLNPFNLSLLTKEDLQNDCLCYLTYDGKPVKASRLFAGNEHEQQVKRLADHFNMHIDFYQTVKFDTDLIKSLQSKHTESVPELYGINPSAFGHRELSQFVTYEEAYHQLMLDIATQQAASTGLVFSHNTKQIFVDGGFSNNCIYMQLLAAAFPQMKVYAASMAQATAVGAALAIHTSWNSMPVPKNIIELQRYSEM